MRSKPLAASNPILASSLPRALDIIGDRWTTLIIRDAYLGLRRFEQFQKHLGIARQLLADRLKRLVAHGLLVRVPHQPRRFRCEYLLTPMGRDLYGLGLMIRRWEHRWGRGVSAIEIIPIHRQYGRKMIEPEPICANYGNVITADQTSFEDRTSANDEPHTWLCRQRRSRVTSSQMQNPGPLEDALDILGIAGPI